MFRAGRRRGGPRYERYTARIAEERTIVGRPEWHAGAPCLCEDLRELLLKRQRDVMHWLMCPTCDPDQMAEAMLAAVGWTVERFFAEVMTRG